MIYTLPHRLTASHAAQFGTVNITPNFVALNSALLHELDFASLGGDSRVVPDWPAPRPGCCRRLFRATANINQTASERA